MKKVTVDLPARAYDILIESGALDKAGEYVSGVSRGERLAVVTDETVAPLYGKRVCESLERAGFRTRLIVIPAGEASKSVSMLERLYNEMTAFTMNRNDAVVALGGGVVGDLAGFAAATLLRGVDLIQIPTTLLAQVDSSVGGKVAINLKSGKNLAGAFHQPRLVIIDPDCLESLPDRVFSDGMAEVIKYGAIFSERLLELLESRPGRESLAPCLEEVIAMCCDFKRQVVVEDEFDTGQRMLLNFGHTLGHAYELAYGYKKYTHGEAVASGMCLIARLGEKEKLTEAGTATRLEALVQSFSLPVSIPCSLEDYRSAVGLDKKGSGDTISLIMLTRPGNAFIHAVSKAFLMDTLEPFSDSAPDAGRVGHTAWPDTQSKGAHSVKATILPGRLFGNVVPPPSKSQAHRMLIAAALSEGESTVSGLQLSDDIRATLQCIEQLGAKATCRQAENGRYAAAVSGVRPHVDGSLPVMDCGESGTTLRLMIPVALAICGQARFLGRGRLMKRPLDQYFSLFSPMGISHAYDGDALEIRGAIRPSTFSLRGDISSQFISGLLFALPLLDGESVIELTTPLESQGYVTMTLDTLEAHGITVERQNWTRFVVPGGQRYRPHSATVESDYSQSAFFYTAQGIGNTITISGLNSNSSQGDSVIREISARLNEPGPVTIDVSQCPDLVPAIALHAALRNGETTQIVNAGRLRIKESDRLQAVREELNALGADVREHEDSLEIHGRAELTGAVVKSHNDHRIAMMLGIAASRAQGMVVIHGAESVTKSYPDFWEEYTRLGGDVRLTKEETDHA